MPIPSLSPGEALVRVAACAVNRIDVWARSGRYKVHLPHVLGTDVAGEVASVGQGVRGLEKGSKALIYPVLSDGRCAYCARGQPNLCVQRGFVGIATEGGYAEFVKVPAGNLIPADGIDLRTAAALPVNFGTAWSGLASRVHVSKGDTVLVWGAAGGLGHAAVQVAKHLGATVIAAVGDDGKSSFVRSLGADHVLNSRSEDVANVVRSLTGGLGATVVFDHVGGDTWPISIECLARGGKLIALGLTSGAMAELDVGRIYRDEISIIGTYGQAMADIEEVVRLAAAGKLRPYIHGEVPLVSAREAHEIIEARDVRGKILLVP